MNREPARKIPEGLRRARDFVNELEREGVFNLNKLSEFWSRAEIRCAPFIPILSLSKENIELDFEVVIGFFADLESIEATMSELPISISFQQSLDPTPLLTANFQMATNPDCQKNEVSTFIFDSLLKSLMIVQTALVLDAFAKNTRDAFSYDLPKPGSTWDLGYLVRVMLSNDRPN